MSGLRLHERARTVTEARLDLQECLHTWYKEHEELTGIEATQVVLDVMQRDVANYLRYELRMERHGTYDKKADEE